MVIVHIVIAFALLQLFFFSVLVGNARGKYKVAAPAVSGHELFERYQRVHYNTIELMILFVPSMWLFGTYVSPMGAALLGIFFIAARFFYLRLYVTEPEKRGIGFALSVLPTVILLLGGLGGAIWQALSGS